MRRIAVLVVIALSIFSTSCNSFKAKMEVKKGNELYAAKKYDEAIQKYQNALKIDPNLTQIYFNMGLSYMALYVPGSTHRKDVEYANGAIESFRKYLEKYPDDDKVNEYLINMYLNAERTDEAIQYFETHLQKNPTDAQIMQKLAYLYAKSGKFDESLKWYKRRAEVEPNNPEAYYIIGVICWEKSYKFADVTPEERERLVTTGIGALEKAIQINPSYADAYLYMNLLYREKAKLISLDPNTIPDDRIDEYNGLLAKAKEFQQKAIELRKKNAPAS